MDAPSRAERAYTPDPEYRPSAPPPPMVRKGFQQPPPEAYLYPWPPRRQTLPAGTVLPQDPYTPPSPQRTTPTSVSPFQDPYRRYSLPAGRAIPPFPGPEPLAPTGSGPPSPYQAAYQPRRGSVPSNVLPPPRVPAPVTDQERPSRKGSLKKPKKKDYAAEGSKDDIVELGLELLRGLSKVL